MRESFEPIIVCICCNWCSYAAADLAGSMRLSYPTNIRIVRVPCTGRVDVLHVLKAVEKGADGILVSGCLIGDCHYRTGNQRAVKRIAKVKEILGSVGVNPERVEMVFNSSAMGPQFARTCRDFTEKIRELGPGLRRHSPGAEREAAAVSA